ncbi:MAG: dihydrolipoamide acetyltransferase family protein [Segniliparus sp.]|uniref:dihydrolipoamide acetyltransferase family protein n=1 Tax=Segniliparus sp. TaxID=2804064 RepID=UPI003F3EC873
MSTFLLPDLGEGLADAEIVSWRVHVGEQVALNQVVAEVETAKALVELPSPYSGFVTALLAEEGAVVPVGSPIIAIEEASGDATAPPPAAKTGHNGHAPTSPALAGPAQAHPEERVPVLVGYGVGAAPASRRGERTAPISYRGRARQRPDADTETRTPVTGLRRRTAEAMTRSAFTAPHATVFLSVDATATVELVEDLRSMPEYADRKLTPLALVARALVLALREQPALGASWDESDNTIVTRNAVNLGFATATPRGLVVPNVKHAERLNLAELAAALDDAVTRAREGRAAPSLFTGGTITITNVGVFGVDGGTAIINPGEAAILCVGAISPRPWAARGELAVRQVCPLSLSVDHRVADGESAAKLLASVGAVLENPARVLALS